MKMEWTYLLLMLVSACTVPELHGFRFKYLGCYIDSDGDGRDIVGKDFTFSSLTLETCINQCQPAGYAYAGLQFATRCLCGNSYGRIGYSLFCNCTCGGVYCGGYMSNDVFYAIDNSLASERDFVYHETPKSFEEARMDCVSGNGDLPVVDSDQLISKVITIQSESNSSTMPSNVWIGLHRRLENYPYEWANENAKLYADHATEYAPLWVPNDPKKNCVSVNIAMKKLESKECDETMPFVCNQLDPVTTPVPVIVDENTDQGAVASNPSADSNRLALYIVMPLFLLCYGGSCVLYCAYKIYRNCCMKKRTAMYFDPVPGRPSDQTKVQMGMPPMAMPPQLHGPTGIYKRPLSGGIKKSAVFPASVDTLVLKGGPLPKYEPSGVGDVRKDIGQIRKPVCIPKMGDKPLSPPPSYYGNNPLGRPAPDVATIQLVPPTPLQPGQVGGPLEDDAFNVPIKEIMKKKIMEKEKPNKEHAK